MHPLPSVLLRHLHSPPAPGGRQAHQALSRVQLSLQTQPVEPMDEKQEKIPGQPHRGKIQGWLQADRKTHRPAQVNLESRGTNGPAAVRVARLTFLLLLRPHRTS